MLMPPVKVLAVVPLLIVSTPVPAFVRPSVPARTGRMIASSTISGVRSPNVACIDGTERVHRDRGRGSIERQD